MIAPDEGGRAHSLGIFPSERRSSTTPVSELQIIEVREETRFQPLEIPLEPQQQPFEEEPAQQSEQQKQAAEESSPRNTEPEPPTNHPRKWEADDKSHSISTNSPSQPTQPSEPTVSRLEILEEAVVDAGVMAALKFGEATSGKASFTTAELYKTPEKKKEITEELIEKCYHWMTHVKQTKDSSNEYDAIFVLKHEANYEGVRQHFMSLMPKQQVESTVITIHSMILNQIKGHWFQEKIYIVPLDIVRFMLGTHGVDYTDPRTKKAYKFDINQYAHHRHFLDKRKLALYPFLFVSICNRGHGWLWISDVQKKVFYMLDPVNKKKKDIPESRVKLNKFVYMKGVRFIIVASLY
ncbi:hypothetical protein Ahy_B01g053533 [Arachis hypogaea]|uniref:Ubiquitin-like protease family profile domain-containing protein n=1 Tax=Arachis hypogaea TaxID=3818 RepID=A0A445ARY7_ARAHY|nr:hypothetical protein Ahy_B01g053533 [Arachis hypogaea]